MAYALEEMGIVSSGLGRVLVQCTKVSCRAFGVAAFSHEDAVGAEALLGLVWPSVQCSAWQQKEMHEHLSVDFCDFLFYSASLARFS